VNVPLRPLWRPGGGGRGAYRRAVVQRLLPALRAFNPDLVLLSAGFDGLLGDLGNCRQRPQPSTDPGADPLWEAGMDLRPEDVAWVTQEVMRIADLTCQGRLVSVLEGGYGRMRRQAQTHTQASALSPAPSNPHTQEPGTPSPDSSNSETSQQTQRGPEELAQLMDSLEAVNCLSLYLFLLFAFLSLAFSVTHSPPSLSFSLLTPEPRSPTFSLFSFLTPYFYSLCLLLTLSHCLITLFTFYFLFLLLSLSVCFPLFSLCFTVTLFFLPLFSYFLFLCLSYLFLVSFFL